MEISLNGHLRNPDCLFEGSVARMAQPLRRAGSHSLKDFDFRMLDWEMISWK
ncbi:MAG: hypothetical protein O2779_00070 [Nanoarchaeota archaeon]|nr:hypothetical protein [Nanoarchaeota archaeon]